MTLLNLVQWLDGENNIQAVNSFKTDAEVIELIAKEYPAVTDEQIEELLRYNAVMDEEKGMWLQIVSSTVKA